MTKIVVLRLGHRLHRDQRVSTHVALTARAFGVFSIMYSGAKDGSLEESIKKVVEKWGGPFEIKHEKDWKKVIRDWKEKNGEVIHLTIYGLHIDDVLNQIKNSKKDKLIVVGAEKVPAEVFQLADFNVAIGSQPISEVSALGVFLDRLSEREGLHKEFEGAKLEVIPQARGKKVTKHTS
ncbi:MAG: tRNA (cytidine(56)-2'-O)-methyltransferase [Euryarchaeota archaeon]|nr:tRNA (cytidine(56)-2'-O)-methyltransferase [Euryarchaeota archaeon]